MVTLGVFKNLRNIFSSDILDDLLDDVRLGSHNEVLQILGVRLLNEILNKSLRVFLGQIIGDSLIRENCQDLASLLCCSSLGFFLFRNYLSLGFSLLIAEHFFFDVINDCGYTCLDLFKG